MTNTTPTTGTAPKKMWTRCNGCQERVYNDPHDIKIHAQHCPHDLQLTIQKLTTAVFGTHEIPKGKEPLSARLRLLEDSVGELGQAEPLLDPDGIDEAAYTTTVGTATDSDDEPELEEPDDDLVDGEIDDEDDLDDDSAVVPFTPQPAIDRPGETYDPATGTWS